MVTGVPGYLPFDTNVLIQVVPNLLRPTTFLLDKFFPNIVTADSEFVSIDVDVGVRRMSPFVSPLVEGKLVEQRRFQTNTFKPPYIKDKRAPDLRKPIRRMIGERIGGDMSGQERMMANIAAEMTDQIDVLQRRLEWMAAQVLMTGAVTVSGDGFPTSVVDFGRDPSLTVALTSTARWTVAQVIAGTATPTLNIEAWQRQILKKSGAKVDTIVFTTSSWEGFIADPLLKGAIFYPRLGDSGNVIDPGAQIGRGGIYKGRWGSYDLVLYNEWYITEDPNVTDNVETPMLTDGMVVLCGPDMMGTRAFAQILDPAFNYQSLPYAPKIWANEDPAQLFLMMQSSPITIPSRVNAAFAAQVCDAVYT